MANGNDGHKELSITTEDSDSESEEERIRKLFQTCDNDGDGYIDSNDLLVMCRQLNLENDLEEIMHQLGADEQGRISYAEFLRCRLHLRNEITALQDRHSTSRSNSHSKWPSSSNNSEGVTSFKYSSWDFDSGARDLSPEPNALRKLVEAAGGSVSSNASNLLELANKLHLTALASLKGEVIELNTRFQQLTHERDVLEKQLNKYQVEKIRSTRENEERLEQQALHYEERLTELHSVIAELTKKFETQRVNVIREEDEFSHRSNESCSQIHSNDNNPNESFTDNEDVSGDISHNNNQEKEMCAAMYTTDFNNVDERVAEAYKEMENVSLSSSDHPTSSHHLAQVHVLQSENVALQNQLSRREAELNKARNTLGNMRDERDRLRKKIRELQSKIQGVQSQSSQGSQTGSPTHTKVVCVNSTTGERTPTSREDAPITKIAERIKLKKMESGDRHILGADFASLGVTNTKVVEHLVRPLQDESSAQEIFQSLYSAGSHVSENCIREFEVEMERLSSRIEHLKAQNDLLTLTLDESKALCDRLSVLIGKYESNCTAYQLAITNGDQVIDSYETIVSLLETEIGLLLANCRVAGLGMLVKNYRDGSTGSSEQDEAATNLKKAQDMRKNSEIIAKRLLQRLDRNKANIAGNMWEEISSHTTGTTSSTSSGCEADFSKNDEQRIRDFINQLKNSQNVIRTTVMELESIHVDPFAREPALPCDAQKFDLENAVLVQELMAIKEEKAELKAQVYLLERERAAFELRLHSREAQEEAYVAHIDHLKNEMKEQKEAHDKLLEEANFLQNDRPEMVRYSDASLDFPQELAEALQREKKLKVRLQELVTTLEKVTKNSELRHQQSAEFVNDLKRANSALVAAFEKSKRKYQSKIKKMEQQMLIMVDRHSSQVRMLKQRIGYLEDETSSRGMQLATSETSL